MRRFAYFVATLAVAQTSDYDRGVALAGKGNFEQAVPLLVRAAQSSPKDARAWKALGVAYAAQNLYDLAEPPFRRACELDPKLEDACYYLGRALYALDRYDDSLAILDAAARREPPSWKVRLGIAQATEALGKDADSLFRQALQQCRNTDPSPGVAYARYLIRQGRTADAIPHLQTVLARFPNSADAHTHLGRALVESGKPADAIPHLERAVTLSPDSTQAHLLLAKAYIAVGRAGEAEAHFKAAAR